MRDEPTRRPAFSARGLCAGFCLLLALGAADATVQAQDPDEASGDTTAAQTPADSAQGETDAARYQREVFTYPAISRRDPFRPLVGAATEGPRFENLVLSGVIYNSTVGSVAVLVDRATGRRHRVREGQLLGEIRIDEIRRAEVEVLVPTAGERERRVLRVETQREEGDG